MDIQVKTIFIAVSRGLICRNILRTGVLDFLLQDKNVRVIVLLPKKKENIPIYFEEEFRDSRITFLEIENYPESFFARRIWCFFINNLVYTESTDLLAREGSAKVHPMPGWWYPLHRILFGMISKSVQIKKIARWIEKKFIVIRQYDEIFKKYKPHAIFVGSVISHYDMHLLKAAERHGVPTVGMQKGWDNLERQLIRAVPDHFLLQNSVMMQAANRVQGIENERLVLTGFPQFDLYSDKNILPSKKDFCSRLGISEDTKIFLFGSEGLWTPQDDRIIDLLVSMREQDVFPFSTTFIIRPHFSDIRSGRFERFRGLPGIIIDTYRFGTYFFDGWDPTKEEMVYFAAEMNFISGLICYASTLSLDGACFDKPIINVTFSSFFGNNGIDMTNNLYKMRHYQPVMSSGALDIVSNKEELKQAIIRAVEKPELFADGRRNLRETLCGPLDGFSARRVAQAILDIGKTYGSK